MPQLLPTISGSIAAGARVGRWVLTRITRGYLGSAVLVTIAVLAVLPAPSAAIGLLSAYRAALENDPTMRSVRFENTATHEGKNIARAALRPAVTLGYTTSQNSGQVERPGEGKSPTEYTSQQLILSVRQPIYNREALIRDRQATTQSDYSDTILLKSLNELALRLASGYLDVLLAEEQRALSVSQRDSLLEARARAVRLFEKGEGTRTDLLEAGARSEIANTQLLEAEVNVRNRRQALAAIIDYEPEVLENVRSADRPPLTLPGTLLELERHALDLNPDILAQRKRLIFAEEEIERTRAGHFPRLDLVATHSQNQSESVFFRQQQTAITSIGVQLNIPVYSGGGVAAQTAQALARRESVQAELDRVIRATLVEVRRQFEAVASGHSRVLSIRKSELAAREVVEATRKSIAGGQRINLDLLNATQQLFVVRRDLAEARFAYLLSFLRLNAAIGVVGEQELSQIAALQGAED